MKLQYIALIMGISLMSVSYAQPNIGQGMSGQNSCPQAMPPGQCRMHNMHRQGMSCGNHSTTQPLASDDPRTFVNMPPKAQLIMRQDMLTHLSALTQILSFLAAGQLNQAAEIAETQIGRSAMGKHRGTGMGPGRFMPPPMRQLGWNMHNAGSAFAQIAKNGDIQKTYNALATITATCTACHNAYRTR
jgi:hypothetical protein